MKKFEEWIDAKTIPFELGKAFFKKGSMNIKDLKVLFSDNENHINESLQKIYDEFTQLQYDSLQPSPIAGNIILTDPIALNYEERFRNIRNELLKLTRN